MELGRDLETCETVQQWIQLAKKDLEEEIASGGKVIMLPEDLDHLEELVNQLVEFRYSSAAVKLIDQERERQITILGFTEKYEDKMPIGQLAGAGIAYAFAGIGYEDSAKAVFPGSLEYLEIEGKSKIDLLVEASALICAEIDKEIRKKKES